MLVLLSKSDPVKLELASEAVSKVKDAIIVFLSDASYLTLDGRNKDILSRMREDGATLFAMEADIIRRNAGKSPDYVNIISYEELVEILVEKGGHTINL